MHDTPEITHLDLGWTDQTISERCRVLRGTLQARRVPDLELDAMAPGGARNQTADPLGAAVVWYALLRARFELEEERRREETARAQEDLADALASVPRAITLSGADAPRAVYPKSYHALRYCDALDHALQGVSAAAAALEAADVAELQALAPLTESLAVRLWAWIITHPAPDLPFDDMLSPEPPAWTRVLTPDDLLTLLQAHFEVNRRRIARIAQLFPGDRERESRLALSGFLGTIAQELGHRPFDVLRRWTLGEAFAQAVVASQASREARTAAEADALARKAS